MKHLVLLTTVLLIGCTVDQGEQDSTVKISGETSNQGAKRPQHYVVAFEGQGKKIPVAVEVVYVDRKPTELKIKDLRPSELEKPVQIIELNDEGSGTDPDGSEWQIDHNKRAHTAYPMGNSKISFTSDGDTYSSEIGAHISTTQGEKKSVWITEDLFKGMTGEKKPAPLPTTGSSADPYNTFLSSCSGILNQGRGFFNFNSNGQDYNIYGLSSYLRKNPNMASKIKCDASDGILKINITPPPHDRSLEVDDQTAAVYFDEKRTDFNGVGSHDIISFDRDGTLWYATWPAD